MSAAAGWMLLVSGAVSPRSSPRSAQLSAETALNHRIEESGSPNFAFFPFQLLLALPLLLTAALIQKYESSRPAELHLACFSLATVLSVRSWSGPRFV